MDESSFAARQLFLQGSYKACVATIGSHSAPSPSLQLYSARAQIALGQTTEAAQALSARDDVAARAVILLAEQAAGATVGEEAVAEADGLIAELSEEAAVEEDEQTSGLAQARAVLGTVLANEGQIAAALSLLGQGVAREDEESVAVQIQLLLSIDRTDLAQAALDAAKRFADDSSIIQLAEAWVNLRTGGAAYQQAFYTLDELTSGQAPSSVVLNGKAVAQAVQCNAPEAEAALAEASSVAPADPITLANQSALLKGAAADQAFARLQQVAPAHLLVADLAEKSAAFDAAAAKFAIAA